MEVVTRYESNHIIKKKSNVRDRIRVIVYNAFQLYHVGQFFWWRTPEYPEKITDKVYHISSTPCHKRDSNSQR